MKGICILSMALAAGTMFSCDEDVLDMDLDNQDLPEITVYATEVFPDLTPAQVEELETPFENLMAALEAPNARVLSVNDEDLTAAIRALFEGANVLEFYEDQQRGLDVYVVKVLLNNGIIVKISVVKQIYEILSIEVIGEISDLDLDPEGSFISLHEAIAQFESHFNGKIVRAELSLEEDDRWEFEIHIETDEGRLEIEVDAFTGEVLAVKRIEGENKEEFEEEEKEESPEIPEAILTAVADHIVGEVIHGEIKTYEGVQYWNVTVVTSSEAFVELWFKAENAEFVGAGDEEGPFDYEFLFGEEMMKLSEAFDAFKNELSVEIIRWDFEEIWHEEMHVPAIRIKGKTEDGIYHYVIIDATNEDWIKHEVDGVEEHEEPLLPENVEDAVHSFIDATIVHFEKEEDGDIMFWQVKVETESDAKVYFLINEESGYLVAAWDNDGPFDYDVEFGDEEFILLSDAIFEVEEQLLAETFAWEYEEAIIEEVEYMVIKIKAVNPNEVKYVVYIDVETGAWLNYEEIEE